MVGEEELLRARAVSAVRAAVVERHPDAEVHELAAAGLPVGQLADVLARFDDLPASRLHELLPWNWRKARGDAAAAEAA